MLGNIFKRLCKQTFMGSLFIIAKMQKQSDIHQLYEWINKIDYILQTKNAILLSKDYDVLVTYKFALNDRSIEAQLQELSSGSLEVPEPTLTIIEKPL